MPRNLSLGKPYNLYNLHEIQNKVYLVYLVYNLKKENFMSKESKITLTGGTFFTILTKSKKRGTSKREQLHGQTNPLSETNMLEDLMHIASPMLYTPNSESTIKTNTSQFKSCDVDSTSWLCFDDENLIEEFEENLQKDFQNSLKRVSDFTNRYFETSHEFIIKKLGKQLLSMIKLDTSISDEQEFYFISYKNPIKKREIINEKRFSLEGVILGIWYYIVVNKIKNSNGKSTLNLWESNLDEPYSLKNIHKICDDITVFSFSNEDSFLITENITINAITSIDEKKAYLYKLKNKFENIKTLYYKENSRSFYDFYVCNNLSYEGKKIRDHYATRSDYKKTALNVNVFSLMRDYSNFLLITGTGGIGKSMMMRHFLLNSIDEYPRHNMIPIFISLKNFSKDKELIDFIFDNVRSLFNISKNQLITLLINGEIILLLDGLDEIKIGELSNFEYQLEMLTDKYSSNCFVITSRPYQSFVSFYRFHELKLMPFEKHQALDLVNKLEFRTDEPQIKANFYNLLETELFETHKEYAENPLLLTIMLMTFEQYAEIPKKMHIFYREAYLTLCQKHDASKGLYKRTLKTEISNEKFTEYLMEFCCRTYKDEKFEFTYDEGEKYFKQIKNKVQNLDDKLCYDDYIWDLEKNMCLLYQESRKYHLIHRSFQEYFCALYFSKQKDKHLESIGKFFENKSIRMMNDQTFDMLYDMIPEKIEEYIFLPWIKELLKCPKGENEYLNFLSKIFPVLEYVIGDMDFNATNLSNSFLYDFISETYKFKTDRILDDFPLIEEFVRRKTVTLINNDSEDECIDIEDLDLEDGYEPVPDGYLLEFAVEQLLDENEVYHELINLLCSDECQFKQEYNSLKKLLSKLEQKANNSKLDFLDFLD